MQGSFKGPSIGPSRVLQGSFKGPSRVSLCGIQKHYHCNAMPQIFSFKARSTLSLKLSVTQYEAHFQIPSLNRSIDHRGDWKLWTVETCRNLQSNRSHVYAESPAARNRVTRCKTTIPACNSLLPVVLSARASPRSDLDILILVHIIPTFVCPSIASNCKFLSPKSASRRWPVAMTSRLLCTCCQAPGRSCAPCAPWKKTTRLQSRKNPL